MSCTAADQHCVAFLCSAAAEANPACSSGSGCVANAMHRRTPVRNILAAAARLAAGPGLGWLCSIIRQAGRGRHSMDHLLLLLWPAALSPVGRAGPPLLYPSERSSWGCGSATDPSILEKKRKGPSVTDRSRPGLSSPPSPSPADSLSSSLSTLNSIAGLISAAWPGNASSLSQPPSPTLATSRPGS
jgi:hypothetical protein